MTDNNLTTKSDKLEPKYRKKLNQEQVAVLKLLYRFRFASSEQIAKYSSKKSNKFVQKRLKILEDQELIAKRYDKSYKLKGRPAAYYLLPKGARSLEANTNRKADEPINIKRIYKDKDVSESFIEHSLNILSVYLALKTLYPAKDKLNYFTKSQLSYEKYDFLPSLLQDAYIRIKLVRVISISFWIFLRIASRSSYSYVGLRSIWTTLIGVIGHGTVMICRQF